ncbi:centromere/kinetochore protein zw10, partial [Trifolium pratense]
MEKAVRFDGDLNQIEVKYHLEVHNLSGIQLQMVVGILEYGLAKVADLMIKYVIMPFFNRGQPLSFLEESDQDSAVLKIVPSPESK